MKVSKITILSIVQTAQDGVRNNFDKATGQGIKLKAVTNEERRKLRIASYQYILP